MTDPITVRRALETSGLVAVDARVLLGHVLGKGRAWLAAHATETIPAAQAGEFFALAKRRRDGEPVAYLTGTREFWGLAIAVSPAVLIPRPETETLVEMALAWLPADRDTRVLDLGTGSGAIALAIAHERPRSLVLATDISEDALSLARENARRLQIVNIEFARSDWFSAPSSLQDERFDLIVSNPPYVEASDAHLSTGDLQYEPTVALSPGNDELLAIRRIVAGAADRLVAGGALIVEHGYDQEEAVRALFSGAGFTGLMSARDLAGIPRVVGGRKRQERHAQTEALPI